jgi:hypothetical protein
MCACDTGTGLQIPGTRIPLLTTKPLRIVFGNIYCVLFPYVLSKWIVQRRMVK